MRRRSLYVAMFLAPAVLAGLLVSGAFVALAIAVLWAFVFGDDTWPRAVQPLLIAATVLCFAGTCWVLLSLAHSIGREEEARPALNRAHAIVAAGTTALLFVIAAIAVYMAGDFGNTSPEARCASLCRARGFGISKPSPPESGPQACICLDSSARPAATIPLPAAPKR